ncbi:MAG: hypothetical protein LJF04_19295, partial [Gemmatimonadetes bacterium]|nr:hypothetical protein [Gemmatimonadota bacterium]
MRRALEGLGVLFALSFPHAISGQAPSRCTPVRTGMTVELRTDGTRLNRIGGQPSSATVGPLRGTVVRLSADTVTLSAGPSATPTNFAIADVTSARVACGGHAPAGAFAGGAIGALVGYSVGSICIGSDCSPDPGSQRDGAILGGLAGLVAGALVGSLVTRWVTATFDRSASRQALLSEPPAASIPAETLIRPDRRGAWGKTVGGLVVTGTGIGLLIYDPSLK